MTFAGVSAAWMTELTTNVSGLTSATIPTANQHLYAPWAVEQLFASSGERHIAVWPEGEPEVVDAALISSLGSDLSSQSYAVLVWEDATLDASRLQDDETAASAWLALYEAIRARFYLNANRQLGSVDTTAYDGGTFDMQGGARIIAIRFKTRQFLSYS